MEVVSPGPGGDPRRPGLAGRGDDPHRRCRSSSGGPGERAGAGSSCRVTSMSCRPAIRRPGRPTRGAAEVRDGALYGRGACDMKGGVAADPRPPSGRSGERRPRPARRRAHRRARPVRGGRRPGDARRDPGRRDRRPRDHPRAVEPRHRRRPCRRDHVPADRARVGRPTPHSAARASPRSTTCSSLIRALEADEARRNEAETDPLMTALGLPYPTIIGIVDGRRVGLDRARPGHRRRPIRRPARPVGGRRRGRAAGARSPPPVPPTRSCATTRPPSRSPAVGSARRRVAVGSSAAGRPRRDRRSRHGPPARAPRRAVRRGHADVRQRRRDAVRDLRSGRRSGRPQRRRARAARRGRGLRARSLPRGSVGRCSPAG